MNSDYPSMITGILEGTRPESLSRKAYSSVFENTDGRVGRNEFLFFIKPEITILSDESRKKQVLDLLFRKFSQFGFTVHDILILGASYLEQHDIIAKHYGVINALSRDPLKYFSEDAKSRFTEAFGLEPEKAAVLGSLQFLESFPSFTPEKLQDLWQSATTTKLSGGNYCARVMADGREVFLINGFHPKQLVHFTAKGRSIVTFRISSDVDWSIARNGFIGKTNPVDAKAGSLRNELLQEKERYGLQEVSSSQNGFHLSAGPVEGLVELIRYSSDFEKGHTRTPGDFSFGLELLRHFSPDEIGSFCENSPVVFGGKKTNVFDLTEEKNSDEAVKLLKDCKTDQ
jgi:hypothetical protein